MKRRAFTLSALSMLGAQLAVTRGTASAANDTVKVGVAAAYPTYAIYHAAKELGYYNRANLDVEIQVFRGGPAALEAVAAGAIDLCSILPSAAALAIDKGVKAQLVALYAPVRPAGWYIMVPAASPIKTLADLNGKTVGVTQIGSLTDFWVQKVTRNAKVSVTSVPLGGGVLAGLKSKQVDAAILWPLFSYKGLISGDLRQLASLESSLGPTISEGVGASLDIIDKRPDVLRRWLAATSKALVYMQHNEAWTETFLKKYFDDTDDKAIAMTYHDFIMKINPTGEMHDDWKRTALEPPAGIASLPPPERVFSTAFVPVRVR